MEVSYESVKADEATIIDACQDAVYKLWSYDNYFDENMKEGREIIAAVKRYFGNNADISDPWEN